MPDKILSSVAKLRLEPEICYFGMIDSIPKQKIFGILKSDRRKHLYVLGKTGMGKTTLLQNMILQDIYNGYGVCFIDPHGDPSEYILDRIPLHRQNDVIYLNPADTEFPVGLNVLQSKRGEEPFLIASGLMAVFNKIWSGLWSSRMEYILNNTILALLETPSNTLLSVVKMLTDDDFREKIVKQLKDPLVKNFWQQEFANFNSRYRQEAISPILNKVGQFLSSEIMRNILGQQESTIDFREIMDNRKILIVNLSKGRLGEDNSNLLGSLIVAKLQIAAMSRVDLSEEEREDFFVYVDEFQNFTNESFATILSEARKYRLNLILAHQYIAQLTESGNVKVKNAIFGNVGTIISFRLGSSDSDEISREFAGNFSSKVFISLDPTQIAVKLSVENRTLRPFLANSLPPVFDKLNGNGEVVIGISRARNTRPKAEVVTKINSWFEGNSASIEPIKVETKTKKSENTDKKYEESQNIIEIKLPNKSNNRQKITDRLHLNTKSQAQIEMLSEKTKDFDRTKEDEEYFELPN